jgi:hypothetical protein
MTRTEDLNEPIFDLDDDHPAKKFLEAFIDCLDNCVGRHHEFGGQKPIDQGWTSATDHRAWTFSSFAYAFLSYDIELDGCLQNAPFPTGSEIWAMERMPLLRSMMHECANAARHDGNVEILELTDEVLQMLRLWEEYLDFRRATAPR